MSTPAQIEANRQNATHSTGPITQAGLAAIAGNRRFHGLTGRFLLLDGENPDYYADLHADLRTEHQPQTPIEESLIETAAQHQWLVRRALRLQHDLLDQPKLDQPAFALYLRYQTTNERSYYKALSELRTSRKEKRNHEIGFESQKRSAAEETRKQETHEAKIRLTHARASATELDTDVRGTMDAPLPGEASVRFEEMSNIFRFVLRNLNQEFAAESAKAAQPAGEIKKAA